MFDASLLHFSRVANTIIVEKNRKIEEDVFGFYYVFWRISQYLTMSR